MPAKKVFGPSYQGDFPEEMRRQLWPLCCGASIISGFKNVHMMSDEELVKSITDTIDNSIADHQVYAHEQMNPKLTFLTLNNGQMGSKKLMDAIKKAGFVQFAVAKPRGNNQGFFVRDTSDTFTKVG